MNDPIEVFTPASHHNVFALIFAVAVLLLTARTLGEICLRFKLPSVIGEILAGIVLGPSLLGNIFPLFHGIIIPDTAVQGYLLEEVSLFGAMFLLLLTGMETDLRLIKHHARTALGVSFGGIMVTFSLGLLCGLYVVPDFLLIDPQQRMMFALFMATAMSISAIPVIAKVLFDMNVIRRDIGQTIIAAGMSDDTIGWILLSIVAGLASDHGTGAGHVVMAIGKVGFFFLFSFTVAEWCMRHLLNFVQDRFYSVDRLLTGVVVLMFFWGAIAQWLHLEPVLGAFIVGIMVGRMPRIPEHVYDKIESISLSVFAPIFFAVAGLKVNFTRLLQPDLLGLSLIIIALASVGKIVGTYAGARLIGRKDHWSALAFGSALNARGAMEIIIATIGLSLGILSQDMFSIIVLMAMVTSLVAPVALRWVLIHVQMNPEEKERLQIEQLTQDSIIEHIHRVLVPLRHPPSADNVELMHLLKARILESMSHSTKLSVTLLCIGDVHEKKRNQIFLERIGKIFHTHEVFSRIVSDKNPVQAIIHEAKKDYDLLILGATESRKTREYLFSNMIDHLVKLAPCATMVVQGHAVSPDWHPHRILVPTKGSTPSRHAVELAFLLSAGGKNQTTTKSNAHQPTAVSPPGSEGEVLIINVVESAVNMIYQEVRREAVENRFQIAEDIVSELQELGRLKGISSVPLVRSGTDAQSVIVAESALQRADLIILGTDVRVGSRRLYLGPRVEHILTHAPCPCVVLNTA